jgi:hypothetical protein
MRAPRRGREHAIHVARSYLQRNRQRSGIAITEAGYVRTLREALALLDATASAAAATTATPNMED